MEEEIKIRKKRTAKAVPPFLQLGVTGEIKEAEAFIDGDYIPYSSCPLRTSIYVDYIPMQLLCIKDSIHTSDEAYVNYDREVQIRTIYQRNTDDDSFTSLVSSFGKTGNRPHKNRGFYSLMLDDTPHVLAVTAPENLVYHKLSILKNNTIDLSKVIILIDSALDSVTFPNNALRQIYRTQLLPLIIKTSCTVFKVPQQFIQEKCFYDTNSTLPFNIFERRKRIEEIGETFRAYMREKTGDRSVDSSIVEGRRLLNSSPDLERLSEAITMPSVEDEIRRLSIGDSARPMFWRVDPLAQISQLVNPEVGIDPNRLSYTLPQSTSQEGITSSIEQSAELYERPITVQLP